MTSELACPEGFSGHGPNGSRANDKAKVTGKTIVPKDILEAVKAMEFEEFIPKLEKELKGELSAWGTPSYETDGSNSL